MKPASWSWRCRHPSRVLPWLLLIALGACAVTPPAERGPKAPVRVIQGKEKAEREPASAQDCCPALRNVAFEPLRTETEVKLRIRSHGPSFDFPEGASFYHGLELPGGPSGYHLQVVARLVGSKRIEETHVFYPTLLFLDQDLREVSRIDPGLKHGYRKDYGDIFTAGLTLPSRARYLVIYTDKSRLQERLYIAARKTTGARSPGTLSPGVNISQSGMHYSNRGATGQLHLRLEKMP